MGMMQIWMSMLTWNAVILERYASTSSLHKATRRRTCLHAVGAESLNPNAGGVKRVRCFIGNAAVRAFVRRDVLGCARCQPNYLPSAREFLKQIFSSGRSCPIVQSFLYAPGAMPTTVASQEARTRQEKPVNPDKRCPGRG